MVAGLPGFRAEDVVESVQVKEPPEDVSKVWVFVLLFQPPRGGLSVSQLLVALSVLQTTGKKGGVYPRSISRSF